MTDVITRDRYLGGSAGYPFPESADFPGSSSLATHLDRAAARLADRLLALDVQGLAVSDYFKRYLTDHLERRVSSLQLSAHLLFLSLRGIGDIGDVSLVDYGGGTGLLSLLAREAGVGTVVYNDIYDVSCSDARTLASAIGLEADRYVLGDIGDLISDLRATSIECRAIVSADVIEHVYDIDAYLTALPGVSTGPLRLVMATTANSANPLIAWRLARIQKRLEHVGNRETYGRKQRDTAKAYKLVREDLIRGRAPRLSTEDVRRIGAVTRGMIERDIESVVDAYLATGSLPAEPEHPTNTCDPYTGNWAEQLMDPRHLAAVLEVKGVQTDVRPGYWGDYRQPWKRLLSKLMNAAIRLSGSAGLRFAPTYILLGDRPGSKLAA